MVFKPRALLAPVNRKRDADARAAGPLGHVTYLSFLFSTSLQLNGDHPSPPSAPLSACSISTPSANSKSTSKEIHTPLFHLHCPLFYCVSFFHFYSHFHVLLTLKDDNDNDRGGILGFKRDQETIVEDEDEEDEEMQDPEEPRPSWLDLNVETDLDVLLDLCRHGIQNTLALWNHPDRPAEAMLVPVAAMVESVRNYTFHRHDLPDTALKAMRSATLSLLSTMKDFELRASLDDLATERRALADYVEKIETHCFSSHPQPELSPSKTLWPDENDLGKSPIPLDLSVSLFSH